MKKRVILLAIAMVTVTACEQSKSLTPTEKFAQKALQSARDSMKDPTSVKFKNVQGNAAAKCIYGEVLAKNGYGAYSGYNRFVWVDGELFVHQKDSLDSSETLIAYVDHSGPCVMSMLKAQRDQMIDIPEA